MSSISFIALARNQNQPSPGKIGPSFFHQFYRRVFFGNRLGNTASAVAFSTFSDGFFNSSDFLRTLCWPNHFSRLLSSVPYQFPVGILAPEAYIAGCSNKLGFRCHGPKWKSHRRCHQRTFCISDIRREMHVTTVSGIPHSNWCSTASSAGAFSQLLGAAVGLNRCGL